MCQSEINEQESGLLLSVLVWVLNVSTEISSKIHKYINIAYKGMDLEVLVRIANSDTKCTWISDKPIEESDINYMRGGAKNRLYQLYQFPSSVHSNNCGGNWEGNW